MMGKEAEVESERQAKHEFLANPIWLDCDSRIRRTQLYLDKDEATKFPHRRLINQAGNKLLKKTSWLDQKENSRYIKLDEMMGKEAEVESERQAKHEFLANPIWLDCDSRIRRTQLYLDKDEATKFPHRRLINQAGNKLLKKPSWLDQKMGKEAERQANHKFLVNTSWLDDDSEITQVYVVDLYKGEATKFPHPPLINEAGGPMVVLGSVLYLIGNYHLWGDTNTTTNHDQVHSHGGVSYLDLREDNPRWKAATPLKFRFPKRYVSPDCVAMSGKIFVFDNYKFGQVFDPIHNNWDDLLPPPPATNFNLSIPVLADMNRILLHFKDLSSLYAYYPNISQWELLDKDVKFCRCQAVAIHDRVIYFYLPPWYAYDIVAKKWLNIKLSDEFDDRIRPMKFKALFDLGDGMMCLATRAYLYTTPVEKCSCIYTVKFRVQRESARDVLITTISEGHHTIASEGSCYSFLPLSHCRFLENFAEMEGC